MPALTSVRVIDAPESLNLKPHECAVIEAWIHSVELSEHHHLDWPLLKRKPDPSPTHRYHQALQPRESSPDKQSTTSKSSKISSSTTRSRSPVKRMADLQLTAKPILPYGLDEYATPLPANVQDLYKRLRRIAEGRKVVPQCVRKAIRSNMGARDHRPLRHNFYDTMQETGQRRPTTPAACRRELTTIVETCSAARLWTSQSVNEASWNALVHCPLLKLALYPPVDEPLDLDADLVSGSNSESDSDSDSDFDDQADGYSKPLDVHGIAANSPVTFWDITTARPRADCVPRNVHGDMLESKLVDFCLAVSDNDMLDAALRTIQAASSKGSRSINHTEYSVLTRRPISVSIETKMQGGSSETALSQLSAWAACHLERLRALRSFKAEMENQVLENDACVSIALPLLAAVGTTWKLYFAVDHQDEIARVSVNANPYLDGITKFMADLLNFLGTDQKILSVALLAIVGLQGRQLYTL
ncbi:hypothetical protein N0V84_008807 [Fusarium piperis]|uniref:PD-(D/E)XK nuclease-like domain-containing protein n=1 Tax=Fusarium piperis TaxID=1435070 RepID=A0A9W9BLC5_9HYPO|nr:hypothetical protein N0V84_008807 [Fusarium piperis]